jgi:hypothetical protein
MLHHVFKNIRRLNLQPAPIRPSFVPYRSFRTTFPPQDVFSTTKGIPKRPKPKARPKTTKKRLQDLPSQLAIDGIPLPPLAPWSDTNTFASKASSDVGSALDAAYEKAIVDGSFPRTPLAKEIFCNMRRFEGDVLLTRVGMFYEVSPSFEILECC